MFKLSGVKDAVRLSYEESHKYIGDILYKLCSDCKEWFAENADSFYKTKPNDIKSNKYHPYCKSCEKQRSYKWASKNSENRRATKKKYDGKGDRKLASRVFNKKRRDNGSYLKWQRTEVGKESSKSSHENRKQHKKHTLSAKEWIACKNYFKNEYNEWCCAYCGLQISQHYVVYAGKTILGDFHKEHVDNNGDNDLSNCVPACKSCNTSKHNESLEKWYTDTNPIFSIKRVDKILKWLNNDYSEYVKK